MNNVLFEIAHDEFCCGVYHIGNFQEETYSLFSKHNKPTRFSPEVFETELMDVFFDKIDGDGRNSGGYLLQASLVSAYSGHYSHMGEKQLPELHDYLLLSGWNPVAVFDNSNTGNEVTIYQRVITGEEVEALYELHEGGDNQEGDDDESW